uniref:acyl carrier protein n=1 Tax=Sinorhizobium psoraleae TaxID=520838 RepID=UPI001AEF284F|nr:phosphopantetheine-binding protein [Sinorhizobium psoraleae]
MHPQQPRSIDVAPSSRIERDLGIDSLGRTKLALRIERAFHMKLPTREWPKPKPCPILCGRWTGPDRRANEALPADA